MFELTGEAVILLLRLALVGLIYLFLASIALAASRELRTLARRGQSDGQGRRSGHLIVVSPGATSLTLGDALPLRPVTRIGRAAESSIMIDGTFVSAEHAVISRRDGTWWLADRGSTNGTALNDRPVHGEVELRLGDIVAIGDVRLRLAP
jgi:hypothetical protein